MSTPRELRMKSAKKCEHVYYDGAGHYCKLIPMEHDEDYPHKHWRVFCHGHTDFFSCEGKKRGLLTLTRRK